MKRAEVWQGYGGEWYVLTTHCRPRHLRRTERIAESAFPEDHEDNDEKPFPTHTAALAYALAEVGLARPGLPLHLDWANHGISCSTCDDGGCPDCTDRTS